MSGTEIEFLRARLDEDEAAAKSAAEEDAAGWFTGTSEEADERSICYTGPSTLHPGMTWDYRIADRVPLAAATHITRHDPARGLREVEAGRRILALYAAFQQRETVQGETGEMVGPGTWAATRMLHEIIKIRAAIYGDHPDYRDEWKP